MIPPKPKYEDRVKLDPFRTPATVSGVKHYFEEHVGQMTSYVFCDYDDGGTQGFGGLALGPKGGKIEKAWEEELLNIFCVTDLKHAVGKRCYVLRCFDQWNANMEGIENTHGDRLTIRGFVKRQFPDKPELWRNPLVQKEEDLRSSIAMHERRAAEGKIELRNLRKGYKSWEE